MIERSPVCKDSFWILPTLRPGSKLEVQQIPEGGSHVSAVFELPSEFG